jgi:cell division septation protein DedD
LTYAITAEAYDGAQAYGITYTGPRGITWDNFDTCVDPIAAAGTAAEADANSCSNHYNLTVRVLRRTDRAGNNEIMGAGSCCNSPTSITATTEQCAIPAPTAAPTTAPTAAPTEAPTAADSAAAAATTTSPTTGSDEGGGDADGASGSGASQSWWGWLLPWR